MKKKPPILVDMDGVVLTASMAAVEVTKWDNMSESLHVDIPMAKDNVKSQMQKYLEILGEDRPVICAFSDPERRYFRHDIYPQYKGNRLGSSFPKVGFRTLHEWVTTKYTCVTVANLEADDVLGVAATDYMQKFPGEIPPAIVSIDKDLQQIPCWHITPGNLEKGPWRVTPEDGQRFWWQQVLTGDTVDGYPGCKGIGPVRAERILAEAESYPEAVAQAYAKAGYDKTYFEAMANVARILTTYCWDDLKEKPILWEYEGEAFND